MAYGGNVTSTSINSHKAMAGAGDKGNFGVKSLHGRTATHPDVGMSHMAMDDGSRSPAHKGMQGAPDHGPMGSDHFTRSGKA